MVDENLLQRLADDVTPSDTFRRNAKERLRARIEPQTLLRAVAETHPPVGFATRVKRQLARAIGIPAASELQTVAESITPSSAVFLRIRERILASLRPIERAPMIASGLKWASAFAVFLLIIRSLPLFFLAPSTSAEAGVQIIPVDGTVSVYLGGVWTDIATPRMLTTAAMIKTHNNSHATLIMNDDGVFRLGPDSLFKVHDTTDRPAIGTFGPTTTLLHGELWALGLVPPVTDGLSIEISQSVISLNIGSIGITENGTEATVTVYDRGATVTHGTQTVFLVTGESVTSRTALPLQIATVADSAFTDPFVAKNLKRDAVHRSDIAKLQEERRVELAGILPTSFLYPAKRLAEQVDVLFTLTQDGRKEKKISQANTRLIEAIALMRTGLDIEAEAPLSEYKNSLITMAEDTEDNIVQHLLRKQIADASVTIGSEGAHANIDLLKAALSDVGAAVPDANLDSRDIEGYVLVDRLAVLNQQLSEGRDIPGALSAYADIRPYLATLLAADSGVHPLLQKEATAFLVTMSSILKKDQAVQSDPVVAAVVADISPYLPAETEDVLVSQAELNARVQEMYNRIVKTFRAPVSRYNQLLVEMDGIMNDQNRGTLLRRLKAALPYTLGQYVNAEIKHLGDELKVGSAPTEIVTQPVEETNGAF